MKTITHYTRQITLDSTSGYIGLYKSSDVDTNNIGKLIFTNLMIGRKSLGTKLSKLTFLNYTVRLEMHCTVK